MCPVQMSWDLAPVCWPFPPGGLWSHVRQWNLVSPWGAPVLHTQAEYYWLLRWGHPSLAARDAYASTRDLWSPVLGLVRDSQAPDYGVSREDTVLRGGETGPPVPARLKAHHLLGYVGGC